jgi:hypothetical protein
LRLSGSLANQCRGQFRMHDVAILKDRTEDARVIAGGDLLTARPGDRDTGGKSDRRGFDALVGNSRELDGFDARHKNPKFRRGRGSGVFGVLRLAILRSRFTPKTPDP